MTSNVAMKEQRVRDVCSDFTFKPAENQNKVRNFGGGYGLALGAAPDFTNVSTPQGLQQLRASFAEAILI
eukprot:860256-Pelagomonas_calceolata.AAC.7